MQKKNKARNLHLLRQSPDLPEPQSGTELLLGLRRKLRRLGKGTISEHPRQAPPRRRQLQRRLTMLKLTRKEALGLLKKHIPSFGRKFNDEDIYGKTGWLYRDYSVKLPETIPADFCVGETTEYRGETIKFINGSDSKTRRFEKELFGFPDGRLVSINWEQYPGHPHLYPKMEVQGLAGFIQDADGNEKEFQCPYLLNEKKYADNWDIEPLRIVPQEDIDKAPYEWEGYEAGDRTNRFLDHNEILLTAAYISLLRIEGPFFLKEGEYYAQYNKKNLLLSVDSDDEMTFTDKLEHILKPLS